MNFLGSIAVLAGAGASSFPSAFASLDLGTKTTHVDTVVKATRKGTDGNAFTLAFVADDPAGITIVTNPVTKAVTVHFKAGQTVAQLEAAIAALKGAQATIAVQTPGTPANVLAAGADEFVATALAGGVGFFIPPAIGKLFVSGSIDGLQVELGGAAAFATSAAKGAIIPGPDLLEGPFPTGGIATAPPAPTDPAQGPTNGRSAVVAVWNPTAGPGTLKVFGEP